MTYKTAMIANKSAIPAESFTIQTSSS